MPEATGPNGKLLFFFLKIVCVCVYIYIYIFSSFSCESEGRVKLIEKAWFSDQVLEAFSPGELHQESLFPKRNKKQISDCWSALPQAP